MKSEFIYSFSFYENQSQKASRFGRNFWDIFIVCGRNLLVMTYQVRLYNVVKPNSLILRKRWWHH